MLHFILWTVLPTVAGSVISAFVAWNNPKKKVETFFDQEIKKAAHAGQAALVNVLTNIKSRL